MATAAVQQVVGDFSQMGGDSQLEVWESVLAKSLVTSKKTHFQVTMTEWMVKSPTYRMEFPKQFLQDHSEKLQTAVTLVKTWTKGQVWSGVQIKQWKSFDRVRASFNGGGWKSFVIANDLKIGNVVTFMILGTSRFLVHVNDMSVETKECPSPIRLLNGGGGLHDEAASGLIRNDDAQTSLSKVGDAQSEMEQMMNYEDEIRPGRFIPEGSSSRTRITKQEMVQEESISPGDQSIHSDYLTTKSKDSFTNPKFKCPFFIKKLMKSSILHKCEVRSKKRAKLDIPSVFVKTHGNNLKEVVKLCGSSTKVMAVRCGFYKTHTGKLPSRVQFTAGWSDFVDENKYKEGDLLLFMLKEPAFFDVELICEEA